HARVRPVLAEDASSGLEHHGDRGFVVGTEDRAARVPGDAALDDRLEAPVEWDRVRVRAEEDRRAALTGSREAAVEVSRAGADARACLRRTPPHARVSA